MPRGRRGGQRPGPACYRPPRGPMAAARAVVAERTYIAVAGNMGTGKSSLVAFLCRHFGLRPFFEPNDENPYLDDFYRDMRRWAFHSQMFFLASKLRIHQALEAERSRSAVVIDRTIYEDAEIFAENLYRSRRMSRRDYATYRALYESVAGALRPPDLMIYLRCNTRTVRRRIRLRGRPSERDIPLSYVKRLQTLYEAWFARYDRSPVLVLETDRMDYVTDLVDRLDLLAQIERHLAPR